MSQHFLESLEKSIGNMAEAQLFGRVTKILGLLVEVGGVDRDPDEARIGLVANRVLRRSGEVQGERKTGPGDQDGE